MLVLLVVVTSWTLVGKGTICILDINFIHDKSKWGIYSRQSLEDPASCISEWVDTVEASCAEQTILILILSKFQISKLPKFWNF